LSVKTILLTGATGFLGGHLLKTLLEKTDYNIVILARSFSNTSRITNELNNKRVKRFNADNADFSLIFIQHHIDLIIHCATEYGRENDSCYKVLETNLMFPIKLLEEAIKHGVDTFINTDSYFNKENKSYSFLLNYSLSKKSLNLWLKYLSKDIKVINMVLEHVYGENDNNNKFVEHIIQKIAIEQVEEIDLTPGHQKRDFIYVQDVCNVYISAIKYSLDNLFEFKQFNIGTGVATSIFDFVTQIKQISNSNTVLNFGSINYREDEIMYSCANSIDLKTLKIFEYTQIEEGIKKIILSYKKDLKHN
jgi:CDP-paratose synthetase